MVARISIFIAVFSAWFSFSACGAGAPPVILIPPSVKAQADVGAKLIATRGIWSNAPTYTYQWYVNDTVLGGATSLTLTVPAMSGLLKCKVTATNRYGGPVEAWTGNCEVFDPDTRNRLATMANPSVAAKIELDEFTRAAKDMGLWKRMMYVPFGTRHGAGMPIGGGGYPTSNPVSNRVDTPWVVTGTTYGEYGTALRYSPGTPQTQFITMGFPYRPQDNAMFGCLFRVTDNAPPEGLFGGNLPYLNSADMVGSIIQGPLNVPIMGFGLSALAPAQANRNVIYTPMVAERADGYGAGTGTNDGGDQWLTASPLSSPTLAMSYRSVGESIKHSVHNAKVLRNSPTVFPMFAYSSAATWKIVGPSFAGEQPGIQYGFMMLYGTKQELAALPLEQLHALLCSTLLRNVVTPIGVLTTGQSNATVQTSEAAFGRADGVGGLPDIVVNQRNANYGGNPIANWLIATPAETGSLIRDRELNSNAAFNAPVRGFRYAASRDIGKDTLPTNPIVRAHTRNLLIWNQGESDTEYRFEASRYEAQLRTVLKYHREDRGDDMRAILCLVDYDPLSRTYGPWGNFTVTGLTGAAADANGTYAIQPARGKFDYQVAYVWTKDSYTLERRGRLWELRQNDTVVATSTGPTREHPELATGWTLAIGGGTPVFSESRTGNIELVRQAIRNVAASDPDRIRTIDTRDFPRSVEGDNVHWYGSDGGFSAALPIYGARVRSIVSDPVFWGAAKAPGISLQSIGITRVSLHGDANRSYQIQRSTDLIHWSTLAAVKTDAAGNTQILDEESPELMAYYRLLPI